MRCFLPILSPLEEKFRNPVHLAAGQEKDGSALYRIFCVT